MMVKNLPHKTLRLLYQKSVTLYLKSPLRVAWDGVSATAVDDTTVLFTLQKPYAGFLAQLTLGILAGTYLENNTR
jgi:ABC-type transport system substrate-binding protein